MYRRDKRAAKPDTGSGAAAAILLLFLTLLYCASERPSVQKDVPEEPPAQTVTEAEVDLLEYLRDDFTLPPTEWKVENVTIDTSLPFDVTRTEPDTSIPAEDQTAMGWRIQIFASDSFESVTTMMEQARLEFPETGVYLKFEAPYYRIRLGDAQNIVDAEILLRRVQQMGYSGAFRVPSEVYVYPELRLQQRMEADSLSMPADSTDFEAMPAIPSSSP